MAVSILGGLEIAGLYFVLVVLVTISFFLMIIVYCDQVLYDILLPSVFTVEVSLLEFCFFFHVKSRFMSVESKSGISRDRNINSRSHFLCLLFFISFTSL